MTFTVSISKRDFQQLRRLAEKHQVVRKLFFSHGLNEPSTKNVREIIKGFKATKRYNQAFLSSLERGLRESDYFASGKKKIR